MELKGILQALAKQVADKYIGVRHHLHQHPELSYQEFDTSAYIQQHLQALDIPFTIMATTGVVAIIEGKHPQKRCIALRADMDALPIHEENKVAYASKKAGIMHACGHDVHTTCLLGAAEILQQTKEEWEGTIKLIFQPGEEKNPGGASLMIRDGVLQNPTPQAIVALHVHPGLAVGKLSFRKGKVMASADEITIKITGKGGHAAAPHLTTDIVLLASQLIVNLQQIVSRNANPTIPSVLSFCAIHAGNAFNVIPSELTILGTFRTLDEDWRYAAHDKIKHYTEQFITAFGAAVDIKIDVGYPCVFNDAQVTDACENLAKQFIPSHLVEETELRMGAEDFGYYSQQVPGCFFRLGVRNEDKGIVSNVHTPTFDIDEAAIEIGIGTMAYIGASLSL